MSRTAIILNHPTFKVADTLAGLAAGDAFECQITAASIDPSPATNTIPATGCEGPTNSPGKTGWSISIAWLQDWGADPSLSEYAFTNDTLPKFYELTLDSIGLPGLVATGEAYVQAGAYGGTFGDGSAANTSAVWGCLAKPTITIPATLEAAAARDTENEFA